MIDFDYYATTKVVFGKNTEERVGALVKAENCKKVLVHFGGESAKKSGLLDRVFASLKEADVEFIQLGGVKPNPRLSLVQEGIALCKKEGVDFILAVGGGSVIDSAKAIAIGTLSKRDVWDYFEGKAEPEASLPVGCVLTIAAAGSETSNSMVITNEEIGSKRGVTSNFGICRFAIMNPQLTLTLPAYQTSAGIADIIMHTLERYFTPENPMEITDNIAEALLRTVIANGRTLTRNPKSYAARAEIMWAGSLSHNGLTGCGGGAGDWSCHQLGHQLSAKYDLAHGASLAAVWGSWARYVCNENPDRFAQLAENVLEVEPSDNIDKMAKEGIEEMEGFFWAMEMPTSISEAGIELSEEDLKELATQCSFGGTRSIGAFKELNQEDILKIYTMAR